MSREADLRAMREGRFAKAEAFVRSALARTNAEPPSDRVVSAVAQKVVKAVRLTPPKHVSLTPGPASKGKFDRAAYMREYMRKRRSAKSA